jgi:hypothetical protein
MDSYKTGEQRAYDGSRIDIAGQSIFRVQRRMGVLRGIITPLHQAGNELSEGDRYIKHRAETERKELHAKQHELIRILGNGAPSPELEIATQGIWNWADTRIEGPDEHPDQA